MPSMWSKTREKARAKQIHTANFTAGHVNVQEYHLSRVGLRGRKRWLCGCLLVLLYLVVLGNLVLTAFILSVLRFTPFGLPYMVFGSNGEVVFTQRAQLQRVHVADQVQSFRDHNIQLSSNDTMVFHAGPLRQELTRSNIRNSSQILVQESGITIQPFESLRVMSQNGQTMANLSQSLASLPTLTRAQNLSTTRITASKVSSKLSSDLTISSGYNILLGDAGVNVTGQRVTLEAHSHALRLATSGTGTVFIKGLLVLDSPERHTANTSNTTPTLLGYHLCVCSSGKLFRVPANPLGCNIARDSLSPCRT